MIKQANQSAGPASHILLKPFGKAWVAYRMWVFDNFRECSEPSSTVRKLHTPTGYFNLRPWDGPERYRFPWVAWLDDAARSGNAVPMPREHGPLDYKHFVSVSVGSPQWDAWGAWHEARNLPMIRPEKWTGYVWMPQSEPEGFELRHHRPMIANEVTADEVNEGGDHHAFG